MSLPVLLTSDMLGAPTLAPTNNSLNAVIHACLVTGFNTQTVLSASAAGGTVTLVFAGAHGFSPLDTVTVLGSTGSVINGKHRVQTAGTDTITYSMPAAPDGNVGGAITARFSPLGWTRPFSGAGIGCYRQGGQATYNRFARVYDATAVASGHQAYVRGYENMTAVSTGTGAFPTTGQMAGNGHVILTPIDSSAVLPAQQHRAWVVVGTPRFFAMFFERDRSMAGGTDVRTAVADAISISMYGFMFGDLASTAKPAESFATVCSDCSMSSTLHVPRAASGTGSAVAATVAAQIMGAGSTTMGLPYPSPADGGIHFVGPPAVYDSGTPASYRGAWPGAVCPMEAPFSAPSAAPPAYAAMLTGVSGITGRVMLTRHAGNNSNDLGWLLDEDWGDI